jgi:hypothetical protein
MTHRLGLWGGSVRGSGGAAGVVVVPVTRYTAGASVRV